jgi:hypothetical protein
MVAATFASVIWWTLGYLLLGVVLFLLGTRGLSESLTCARTRQNQRRQIIRPTAAFQENERAIWRPHPLASTIIGPLSAREAREPFVPPESPGGGRKPASTHHVSHQESHREATPPIFYHRGKTRGPRRECSHVMSELEEAMPQHLVSTLQAADIDVWVE